MMNGPAIIEPRSHRCSASDVLENETSMSMSSSFTSLLGMLNAANQTRPQKRLRLDLLGGGIGQNNASSPDDEHDSSAFASNCSLHSASAARNEPDTSDFEKALLRGGSLNLKLLRPSEATEFDHGVSRQNLTVNDLRRTITWRSIKRNYEFMMREAIISSSTEKVSQERCCGVIIRSYDVCLS